MKQETTTKGKGGIKNAPIYIISSHRFRPPANLNKLFSTTGWFRHVRPCTTGIITSMDYLKNWRTTEQNAFAVTKNLTTTATEQCYIKM